MGPVQQNTITLVVAGVGIASTFVGVLAGRFSGRRDQREKNVEQWTSDQRKQEFCEVLIALERSQRVEVKGLPSYSPDQRQLFLVGTEDFYRIVRTRIFTAAEMQALNIEER